MAILEVKDLKKYFPVKGGFLTRGQAVVKAVDGVSFSLEKGETLGLVGESGCGKSTLGRCLLRLLEPTSGRVLFEDTDMTSLPRNHLRQLREHIQIIFQDPYSSLNPRLNVGQIISEPMRNYSTGNREELAARVDDLMEKVGLFPEQKRRYPHQFSGGQRQRIGIARALALNPKIIVCDEPVSALDVSIQAQVINLLQELQEELELSYLFIAHDLSVVEHISDRVAVMYLGKIVELARDETIYLAPRHPYTRALLSAVPIPDPEISRQRIILEGDVPSPLNPPQGCLFHPRCRQRQDICQQKAPEFRSLNNDHWVACHLA